ncbi:TetR/AcrR family transcriptional regulator [Paraburkholderia fungorum]|uniref:TetR family transcriptional regulator n=1 Tax=Paraburkholderia fungorum TaxID=134537 RepID=UPI001C1EE237|nr:TetR/AcrR family transcriptional regulator [Paraburkholderia fungorum]
MKNARRPQSPGDTLKVLERVQAAVLFLRDNNGYGSVTVSAVCRAAGVSRANLYQHHRDVVDEISRCAKQSRSESASKGRRSRSATDPDLRAKDLERSLNESESRYRAVLYVCLEQQAEIVALRQELESQLASTMPRTRARTIKSK